MDNLSSAALLRDWAFRSFYAGATVSPLSAGSRIRTDLCSLLLFGNLLSQLEMSTVPSALFSGLFYSQSFWR
jgi:hypothetical protein